MSSRERQFEDYLFALHDTIVDFDIITDYIIIYDEKRKKKFKKYKKKLDKMSKKVHKAC